MIGLENTEFISSSLYNMIKSSVVERTLMDEKEPHKFKWILVLELAFAEAYLALTREFSSSF